MTDAWLLGSCFLLVAIGLPAAAIAFTWPQPEVPRPAGRRERRRLRRDDPAAGAERVLVGLGLPITALIVASELAARAGILTAAAVWAYAGAAAVASALLAVRRRRIAAARWRAALAPPGLLGPVAAVCTLLAACGAEISLAVRRSDSFTAPTSWYYWRLSTAIAHHGGVPTSAVEWGTRVHFFDYHLGFSAFGAAVGLASGRPESLVAAQLIRITTVCGAVFGLYLLARVFGASRMPAVAAAVAVPTVAIFNSKLASIRPESSAYFLMLACPAILYCYLRRRTTARLVALLILFLGVSQLHTPAAMVSVTFCAAIAVTHVRLSWRRIGAVGLVLAAMVTIGLTADLVTGHRGPLRGGFADPPELAADGSDPTYAFSQLAVGRTAATVDELGQAAPSASGMLSGTMRQGFVRGANWSYWGALGLLGVLTVGAVWRRRGDILRLIGAGAIAIGALILIGYLTSLQYETFVPLRTVYSRLLQLWWFIPLAILPLLPSLVERRGTRQIASVALLVCGLTLAVTSVPATLRLADFQPSRATLRSLRALRLDDPGAVLTNSYTQGFVTSNVHAHGLLDGQAPYIDAPLLTRANDILHATGQFMQDSWKHPFPFDRYHVRYVLVGTAPSALGNPTSFATDIGKLRLDGTIERVAVGPGYELFRVRDAS